jgi:hypothetical protein
MKKPVEKIFNAPWYFLTYAAYPVLVLLFYNLPQVGLIAALRPTLVSMASALLAAWLFRLIYKDWHRAAFATAALEMLFYTYGYVRDSMLDWKIPHLPVWLGGLWLILMVLVPVWVGKPQVQVRSISLTLNVISLGLVLMAATQETQRTAPTVRLGPADAHAPVQALQLRKGQTPPDIYYIIMDSYARSDLLESSFGYDNRDFISFLQQQGFTIAGCSQSNYPRTDVSVGSSLNLDYLQKLDGAYHPENLDRTRLWDSVQHSTVRYELEQVGYKTVAFATGSAWDELTDAAAYFSPSPVWSSLTEFETMLLRTTPLRLLEDLHLAEFTQSDADHYRERTLLILNSMDKLARMPGPKFVYIHLLPPHPLFAFGPDGSPTDPHDFMDSQGDYPFELYANGYRNQLGYISGQLKQAVATLLADSPNPPVIIIQGDHAAWFQSGAKQFQILNAYYLPNHSDMLYPSISPVNTFRVVLDAYLGAHYPLLEDASYDSSIPNVFDFTRIDNACPK